MTMTLISRQSDGLVAYILPSGAPIDLAASPAVIGSLYVADVSVATHAVLSNVTPPGGVGNGTHIYQGGAWTPTAATVAAALEMTRMLKLVASGREFDARIAAGFTLGGHRYQIDEISQRRIGDMGSLASAALANPTIVTWPTGFTWIDAANATVPMTAAQCLGFAATIAGYVSACILRLRGLKTAIGNATSQTELDAIDVTSGWPPASA